jgi:hypothetical protein
MMMPVPVASLGAFFVHGLNTSGRRTVENIFTTEFSIAAAVASLTIAEAGIEAAAEGGGGADCFWALVLGLLGSASAAKSAVAKKPAATATGNGQRKPCGWVWGMR